MSLAISRRDRRTLLAGAGITTALFMLAKGFPAWRAWDAGVREAAAETIEEAAHAERSLLAFPAVRDSLVARNARYLELAELIVPGDGPASAAAELATFVSGNATAADLALGALQVRADTAGGDAAARSVGSPFARVSVRGDLMGDVDGLTHFLAAIEGGPFLLAVRELAITQPEPAAPADRPEMLRVQFVVEGIALRLSSRRDSDSTSHERREGKGVR